ncbi:hypothetical protein HKCCE2091_07330 [Rhodobacterales bacterium HKCCE2091]|nr:hypothetical protein [Rhodobacterales bacterium HKCCE2091]
MAVEDRAEFLAWLQEQPNETCVAIAYRAALRVLSFVTLFDQRGLEAERLALSSCRALLISGVGVLAMTSEVRDAARAAAKSFSNAAPPASASRAAADAASDAANALADADDLNDERTASAARAAVDAAYTAARGAGAATARATLHANISDPEEVADAAYVAAYRDAGIEGGGSGLVSAVNVIPEEIRDVLSKYSDGRTDLLGSGGPWSFWARWYQAAMAGIPLPWELQQEIALIPNAVWDAGPEAVAEAINLIEAKHDLRRCINELERDRNTVLFDRHGIGGNSPPEPIEELPGEPTAREVVERVVVVWDALADLKEETKTAEPDVDKIRSAIDKVLDSLAAIVRWTGGKLDLTVDTFIKWGVPAGCGYLVLNPGKLQALVDAAQRFLAALP